MEKIFHPSKWLIVLCGLIVVFFILLQYVAGLRLTEESKLVAEGVLAWNWPSKGWTSAATIKEAKIVKRNNSEAVVVVKGLQKTLVQNGQAEAVNQEEETQITLTFYKLDNHWVLGRVEFT
jgi:5-bromo-4-chloroindolyl phosphate hydrolysis protein